MGSHWRKPTVEQLNLCRGTKFCMVIVAIALSFFAGCSSSNGGATVFSIGGTVTGLVGTGLVLENNGGNTSPVNANGPFALNATIAKDSSYSVTVLTQPSSPAQVCVVTNGSGTATANVTNIQVTCTTTAYTIGGTVSGLTGAGLVLQDNGGNNLPVGANGPFTFTTPIDLGAGYNVTVFQQPSGPTQTCVVANGSGTANATVTNVQVTCSSTIGGTVVGLSGAGLVLQYNGGNDLAVTAAGPFTFLTPIQFGSAYAVTVLAQPTGPAQACLVLNGSGTATANVTNVQVDCGSHWTWEGGSSVANQAGVYGTMGVAAPGNLPGARTNAARWTDAAGNLWLFGGSGYDANGTSNDLGDLWKYDGSEWTWVSGSQLIREPVNYGTQGVAAPGNTPGCRVGAATWKDAAGNFWLFGGIGFYTNFSAEFNDVWEYSGGLWTWVSGPNVPFQAGVYGTQGVPAPGNSPGSRAVAATWTDAAGNFWLFGGNSGLGLGSSPLGSYNDVWKYSAGEWTWVGGSTTTGQGGTYGTLGTPAPGNIPGARQGALGWTDLAGNFWLFGGGGYDANATLGDLNDLWKYSGGQWTWMSGANTVEAVGSYGALGVASPTNVPGSRGGSVTWTDASGNLWLFGGSGNGATASFTESLGDVWKYSAGEWTWMGGSNEVYQPGVYEALGLPGDPGGRDGAASWTDSAGNVWIFGGGDFGKSSQPTYLFNDVWKYTP